MTLHGVLENAAGWAIVFALYFIARRIIMPYMKYFIRDTTPVTTCAVCKQRDNYAAITFLVVRFAARIPFVGRFIVGGLASFWFTQILKTGERTWQVKQNQNRSVQNVTPS